LDYSINVETFIYENNCGSSFCYFVNTCIIIIIIIIIITIKDEKIVKLRM